MSHPPTQRQIQGLLADAGLRADRRLGQHFLIDGNLMRLLVREAELGPDDLVLEVGAGVGNLTEMLLDGAGHVVAVEVDPDLAAIAADRLGPAAGLDLLVADVLSDKHHLSPEMLKVVASRREERGARLKLVANLPYAAATPLLAELLLAGPVPRLLVFTVQEEVAHRLAAEPGTGEYGPISVTVQALGMVEVLRRLPPSVFWPRPKVASAMVRIWPSPARRRQIADVGVLRGVVEGLFGHRRKRAPKSLALSDPEGRSVDDWEGRLEAVGLDPAARGETYTPQEIVRLANHVAEEDR